MLGSEPRPILRLAGGQETPVSKGKAAQIGGVHRNHLTASSISAAPTREVMPTAKRLALRGDRDLSV
jgi:hypothetical protein